MKHLLLYTDMAGIYGAEQCTHALSLALAGAGYRVTVAQPHADHHLIAEREAKGVAHHWLAPDNLWDHRHPARALTERAEPEHVLTATAPDLVVFSDGAPFSSLTAKEVAADRGIPYLAIVHCVTPAWASQFAAHLARLPSAFARADAVVAVSQENLDLLHERFGLPAAKGIVIHNGRPDVFFAPRSDPARRQVREELRIPPDAIVCLTVGRFDTAKGYQYQLASFKHLRKSPAWPDPVLRLGRQRHLREPAAAARPAAAGRRQSALSRPPQRRSGAARCRRHLRAALAVRGNAARGPGGHGQGPAGDRHRSQRHSRGARQRGLPAPGPAARIRRCRSIWRLRSRGLRSTRHGDARSATPPVSARRSIFGRRRWLRAIAA